jgi:hypothetical protein
LKVLAANSAGILAPHNDTSLPSSIVSKQSITTAQHGVVDVSSPYSHHH